MQTNTHTPPGLPVVGNAVRFARDPLRFLCGVQEAYGGRYQFVRLDPPGSDPITVVLDAEVVHEVLADRDRFARPAVAPEAQQRQGLLSSDGLLWETQRSVLDPEFVGPRLAEYADISARTVDEMVADWPANGTIDLHEQLALLTVRVITQSLFSQDTTPEQARAIHDALATLSDSFEPNVLDFIIPERFQSSEDPALEAANETLDDIAEEFVDWHLAQSDPPRDMLTALIEAQADPEVTLSDNELVDEAVLFMTGGQETTALTITYALYWLSQHPTAQQRVREEARTVLDGRTPEWGDLAELTFTERVVRETLRLTPAVWNLSRRARQPLELAGQRFGEDEILLLPSYAHHRDSRVWENPRQFNPDRWGETASRGSDSFFPFGSGPRVCIGRQIALTEAQFTLAHVLQQYEVDVLRDDLDLVPSVTLRPSGPVRAELTALE